MVYMRELPYASITALIEEFVSASSAVQYMSLMSTNEPYLCCSIPHNWWMMFGCTVVFSTHAGGPPGLATLYEPTEMEMSDIGDIYITSQRNVIRKARDI